MSHETGRIDGVSVASRAVYERYSAWLRTKLIRRYGLQDAEDLVQEAWLRLTTYRGTADIRHPKALLLKIASNLAADRYAKRCRRDRMADEIVVLEGWGVEMPRQSDELLAKQLVLGLPQPLRDRIIIGEMRDGAAALETLKSWNTGHPGGLSTVHANSAEGALRRVEDLIGEVTSQVSCRMIGEAVDCVVHIRRTSSGRRVEAVLDVSGYADGAYQIRALA